MRIIKTITDEDVGIDSNAPLQYKERQAARAIVFDADGNIGLLYSTKNKYHKLPGGGLEEGEDVETALRREVNEEIGCAITNLRDLATIEEYRRKFSLHQLSHCYVAELVGEKGVPQLEAQEIEEGFQTVWLDLEVAIATLREEEGVSDYQGKFIQARDLAFLIEARNALKS